MAVKRIPQRHRRPTLPGANIRLVLSVSGVLWVKRVARLDVKMGLFPWVSGIHWTPRKPALSTVSPVGSSAGYSLENHGQVHGDASALARRF